MVLGRYLRKLYFDGKVVHQSEDLFPIDIGHWQQSIKLDKRDGYVTIYKTSPSKTGLTRYVTYAKSVPKTCPHHYYTFTLLEINYPETKQKKVWYVN